MKKRIAFFIALALCITLFSTVSASPLSDTTIMSSVEDQYVVVRLEDFPANDTFYVYMGFNGTLGINGYLVSKIATNDGGTFLAKFLIPDGLKGEDIIAIRFESKDSNVFWYNWFFNSTGASTGNTGSASSETHMPAGFPTFIFLAVDKGESITVQTRNFPEDERFAVFMKDGASASKTWYEVDGFDSAEGGIQTIELPIPSALRYKEKIAVKFYSIKDGFVTYNLALNQEYP
jgi:hypothetical protein